MTTQKSKIAIISVIIVCFMISSAYIPAVNALSDDNDRDASYTNIEEVTDDSATGNFDINDLISLIGGDGLKSVLAQLGLDEVID